MNGYYKLWEAGTVPMNESFEIFLKMNGYYKLWAAGTVPLNESFEILLKRLGFTNMVYLKFPHMIEMIKLWNCETRKICTINSCRGQAREQFLPKKIAVEVVKKVSPQNLGREEFRFIEKYRAIPCGYILVVVSLLKCLLFLLKC